MHVIQFRINKLCYATGVGTFSVWTNMTMRYTSMLSMIHLTYIYMTYLTHWCRVTHICVAKLAIIGSDTGLSSHYVNQCWRLLIGPLGTYISDILFGIHIFHSRKCTSKCRLRNGVRSASASVWKAAVISARKCLEQCCLKLSCVLTADTLSDIHGSIVGLISTTYMQGVVVFITGNT